MGLQAVVRTLVIAASTCGVLLFAADRASALDWNPAKTRIFAVGLLEWKHADIWAPFPAAVPNRCDVQLVEYFQKAGVADDRIVYLQDAEATKTATVAAFNKFLDDSDEGELLIFYFAGHGYRNRDTNKSYFATYDAGKKDESGWPVAAIFNSIENRFWGDRIWLIADCCHSGALFDEAKKRRNGDYSYACLTSAYSHNTSTGAWTFTDSLLKALRGRPSVDADGDQVIEWNEMARYVEGEMAFVEGQKSMSLVTGDCTPDAQVAAVRGTAKPKAGRHCEGYYQGKWYKAEVLDFDAASGQYYVHYLNYDAKFDEWLPADRVRLYEPRTFAKGTEIDAYSAEEDKWYPAVVRDSWYGLHLVHYDGFGETWDEWLGPGSVRLRQ